MTIRINAPRAPIVGLAAAEYLGLDGDLGSVANGKLADLLVLGTDAKMDFEEEGAADLRP